MSCVFLLLCVIHRPQSPTPFKKVRYSLTLSNGENWGRLSRSKSTFSVVSSIAVQLSDNNSEIWSSIIFLKAKLRSYRFSMRTFIFWPYSKDGNDHALDKTCWQNCHNISPMKKTVNGHSLFRLQYNCPVFLSNIQDRQRSGQRFFDILILFVEEDLFSHLELSHGRLPNIWLTGEHSDPIATIRTQLFYILSGSARQKSWHDVIMPERF